MTNFMNQNWPYPGSRWWKFDFHTHTPASSDTRFQQNSDGSSDQVGPEKWLLKFMSAEIDCVAITDHNSGEWIDCLKQAYVKMKQQSNNGNLIDGFRELVLFPGVEISVQGGFHLLALFDPSFGTSDIDSLLGRVGYDGEKGTSNCVTGKGASEVVRIINDMGGIPIPAHADRQGSKGKGLLAVQEGTKKSQHDSNTISQVIDTGCLLAVEWENMDHPFPQIVEKQIQQMSKVLGSDCHDFGEKSGLGSRYTWLKLANPTLEGLRLALLDGNDISVRRSDEGTFDPFVTPEHHITNIKIDSARFMGIPKSVSIAFTPYYNAIIGGRGTGKSTTIQAMRLAYRRSDELARLGENTEPYRQFKNFSGIAKGRDGPGALRENTEICLELMRNEVLHKLRWRSDGHGVVVQEKLTNGNWRDSSSQIVSQERFPVRLFSQGQIATLAGEGRQALLDIIDEAANIAKLRSHFEEAKRTFMTQRARLREINGRLEEKPELDRQLRDVKRKLDTLAESRHTDVLKAHQRAQRQHREIEATLKQLREISSSINAFVQELFLDDWAEDIFDASFEADALTWRNDAEQTVNEVRNKLTQISDQLSIRVNELGNTPQLAQLKNRFKQAKTNYEKLQESLTEQGVEGPQAFGNFVHVLQELEEKSKQLEQLKQDRKFLKDQIENQWTQLINARKAITIKRSKFVEETLDANDYVRIEVAGFGFDARNIERNLRDLLDVQDDRFEQEILRINDDHSEEGIAHELATANNRELTLEKIKQQIINRDKKFRGQFRNYLDRKFKTPEFIDHVDCWFPEDDLKIKYSRRGDGKDWSLITQGSQGQRSAALLAFLLAFGDEPLILDQPEDDLDNHLIYDMIVRQIRENKLHRQLIVVTHNPNLVINGDAELVHAFDFLSGQCQIVEQGALQDRAVREEVCRIMEGGREAFRRRWARLGREI